MFSETFDNCHCECLFSFQSNFSGKKKTENHGKEKFQNNGRTCKDQQQDPCSHTQKEAQ